MKIETINMAQEYLTISYPEQTTEIADLELLLKRYEPEQVLRFLRHLLADYKQRLKRLILADKTDSRINDLIARCFRLRMAINTLQKEVKGHDRTQ